MKDGKVDVRHVEVRMMVLRQEDFWEVEATGKIDGKQVETGKMGVWKGKCQKGGGQDGSWGTGRGLESGGYWEDRWQVV